MTAPRKPRAAGAARKAPKKAATKALKKAGARATASGPSTKKAATKKAAVKKSAAKKPAPKKKAPAKAKPARRPRSRPRLDPVRATLALIEKLLDDQQAEDVAIIDLTGKTSIADYMVVASGRNPRHIGAMADNLRVRLKDAIGRTPPVEGVGSADWVLVDAGDVIVHLFRPEVRADYSLEKMWGADWSGTDETDDEEADGIRSRRRHDADA